jgi:hypothetical protein
MKGKNTELGVFGKPVRFYVETAERPWLYVALIIVLIYLVSFWLEQLSFSMVTPFILVVQVLTAVTVAYLVGVRGLHYWPQVMLVCGLVGFSAGVISAIFSLIKWWYPWLILNLITEPVWSGALAALVGWLTLGFFRLPQLTSQWRSFFIN